MAHYYTTLDRVQVHMKKYGETDLVVSCGGRIFHVHKSVVCQASPVLAAECNHQMLEARTGVIEHTEFEADIVEHMLAYMYEREFGLPMYHTFEAATPEATQYTSTQTLRGVNADLIAHAKMFAIGDYYDVQTLKKFAKDHFVVTGEREWDGDRFIEVIREVYKRSTSKSEAMCDALYTVALEHSKEIIQDEKLMAKLAESEDVQSFAPEMFRRVVEQRHADAKVAEERIEAIEELMQNFASDLGREGFRCYECKDRERNVYVTRKSLRQGGEGGWQVRCNYCDTVLVGPEDDKKDTDAEMEESDNDE